VPARINRKGTFPVSRFIDRQQNLVERFFNRIRHFRGLATRSDRKPENFLAGLKLAAIRIWLAANGFAAEGQGAANVSSACPLGTVRGC
jgi:hypothetical protein